jgi:hypothetical protein
MNNNAVTAGDPAETTAEQPATVNKPQGKWKKLPCSFRDRLCELDGYKLKVWLAYLLHGNDQGVAWPSRSTLRLETGLSEDWISKARTALKKKGWLVLEGGGRDDKGRLDAPRLRAIIPEATHTDVTSARPKTVAVEDRHGEDHADHADVNHVHRADVTSAISRINEVNGKEEENPSAQDDARADSFPFSKVRQFYLTEFERLNKIKAPFDGRDGRSLKKLLNEQKRSTPQEVIGWLRNAFQSTETYPLKQGFRFWEFAAHYTKFVRGPLTGTRQNGRQQYMEADNGKFDDIPVL